MRSRRWTTIGAAAVGAVALIGGGLAAAATPAGAQTVSHTFDETGAVQSFTVPAGICGLSASLTGGSGGGGGSGTSAGGLGAQLQAHLRVEPGEVLQILVGGAGASAHAGANEGDGIVDGGAGGFGGGGGGGVGGGVRAAGGGGGATVVSADSTPLLVAGGGGGGVSGSGLAGGDGGLLGHHATAGATEGVLVGGGGGTAAGGGGAGTAYTAGTRANSAGGGGGVADGGTSPAGGTGGGGDGVFGGGGGGTSDATGPEPGHDAGPSETGRGGSGFPLPVLGGEGGAGGQGTTGGGNGGDSTSTFPDEGAGGGGGGLGFGGGGGGNAGGGGGGGYGAGGGGAGGGGGGSSYATPGAAAVTSQLATTAGDGQVIIHYDPSADACRTVLPGSGIVAAPATGTADLAVSVTLDAPSTSTVTVAWTTLFVPGAGANAYLGPQAAASDYTASSGTITFAPGQTTAQAHIPVLADTSPGPDEYVVVSFHDPTNAHMGGFWGLGFGIIVPPA